ncbi:hypothetical protein QPK32_10220 [Massilia sp. YIM B02763]|uniref:protealysin inhibitor emfourin n=1 Tax=Massilia sp. YIM B02763 TaxID=3050130 RepID=UPI0025B69878|nr:protealysin inhibitor emfourin [Massilia sp. YIM B02763]MDN4053454.1 hypothetical protein [Massilia sp. YIM B02763]
MKITARTGGGFAGIERCVELDTGGHADGKAVEALLERLDFFGPAPACPVGADLRRWEITVDDGRRCRTVTVAEDGLPPGAAWQALLDHLRGAA